MKKIIIAANSMNIGGTEKALIGMLRYIDYIKYDVTLLLSSLEGELIYELPKEVKVIKYTEENINFKNCLKSKSISKTFNYIYNAIKIKITKNEYKKYKYSNRLLPKIKEEYDLAISYYMPRSRQVVYVIDNINAKYKYSWMHCDPLRMGDELKQFEDIYCKYDKVFGVSNQVTENTIKLFPKLKGKVETFYNILDKGRYNILAQQNKGFIDEFDGKRILTVGRLSPEKQQDMIIPIMKSLLEEGYNIRWYCIGDGVLRNKLEEEIRENNLEDRIILLGSKKNPYPYFNECDIYVQLSRHEGYCLTLAEARCFNKSIVTTNFSGANEQIINGITGLVVENNEGKVLQGIKKVLDDYNLSNTFRKNLSKDEYSTINEMKKLYCDLVESKINSSRG